MTEKKPLHHRVLHHAVKAGRGAVAASSAVLVVVSKYASPVTDAFGKLSAAVNGVQERIALSATPRMSLKEQMFFMKRLSFLIRASVPIFESLIMISEQNVSRRQSLVLKSVMHDVSNGTSLSKSLGKFPHIFGDFSVNIVKVGESSGTLSQNLEYVAEELKKQKELKQKVAGAFVYPAVITFATIAITGFLVLYLFPKIMPIFSSLHMDLPFTTKVVIAISTFLQHWGLLFILGLVLAGIAFAVALKRSPSFRFLVDGWTLRIPVIGSMLRSYNIANATRTLGLLLKSGLTLSEALPLTADTTQNLVYKKEYRALGAVVQRGERMSKHLLLSPVLFPPVMSQMLSVGERSGNLSNTLVYLSELYSAEVDEFTKNLSSLIEPALMVMMGIIVGFIAVSIITPIYGITQNLHP